MYDAVIKRAEKRSREGRDGSGAQIDRMLLRFLERHDNDELCKKFRERSARVWDLLTQEHASGVLSDGQRVNLFGAPYDDSARSRTDVRHIENEMLPAAERA